MFSNINLDQKLSQKLTCSEFALYNPLPMLNQQTLFFSPSLLKYFLLDVSFTKYTCFSFFVWKCDCKVKSLIQFQNYRIILMNIDFKQLRLELGFFEYSLIFNQNDLVILKIINRNKYKEDFLFLTDLRHINHAKKQVHFYQINLGNLKIISAKWHPRSTQYIFVLEGNMKLQGFNVEKSLDFPQINLDLKKIGDKQKKYFVDFCFSSCSSVIDFSDFCIYFLSNRGQIFNICPFILESTVIEVEKLHQLQHLLEKDDDEINNFARGIIEDILDIGKNLISQQQQEIRISLSYKSKQLVERLELNQMQVLNKGKGKTEKKKNSNYATINCLQKTNGKIFLITKNARNKYYSTFSIYYCASPIFPFEPNTALNTTLQMAKITSIKLKCDLPLYKDSLYEQFRNSQYPKLLSTQLMNKSVYILTFNKIYEINLSGLYQMDQNILNPDCLKYLQNCPIKYKILINNQADLQPDQVKKHFNPLNYGFYSILLISDLITLIRVRNVSIQKQYLENAKLQNLPKQNLKKQVYVQSFQLNILNNQMKYKQLLEEYKEKLSQFFKTYNQNKLFQQNKQGSGKALQIPKKQQKIENYILNLENWINNIIDKISKNLQLALKNNYLSNKYIKLLTLKQKGQNFIKTLMNKENQIKKGLEKIKQNNQKIENKLLKINCQLTDISQQDLQKFQQWKLNLKGIKNRLSKFKNLQNQINQSFKQIQKTDIYKQVLELSERAKKQIKNIKGFNLNE